MSIASPSVGAAVDADRLCALIVANVEPLRQGSLGSRFSLEDVSFQLRGKARNTIYQVASPHRWFLKLPRSGFGSTAHRERMGTDTARAAVGRRSDYEGAAVVRVATDPAYVLTTAIPGRPLNRVVFTEGWMPGPLASERMERTFSTLGSLLAAFHLHGRVEQGTPAATTRPFLTLKGLLDRRDRGQRVGDAIAAWHERHMFEDAGTTFLHGNLRLDNILRSDRRLGFIDFENCGTGSPYQDLSRPVSELLLTRCITPFPHSRVARWIRAFIAAYADWHAYEPRELAPFVCARLARYYLESHGPEGFIPRTIGGLPVIAGRLDQLVLDVLQRPLEDVMPEIVR